MIVQQDSLVMINALIMNNFTWLCSAHFMAVIHFDIETTFWEESTIPGQKLNFLPHLNCHTITLKGWLSVLNKKVFQYVLSTVLVSIGPFFGPLFQSPWKSLLYHSK